MAIDVCRCDIARSLGINLSRRSGQTGDVVLVKLTPSPSTRELFYRWGGQIMFLRFVFCFFLPSLLDVYTAQHMHFVLYSLRDTCLDRRPLRDIMCGMCPSQWFMAVSFYERHVYLRVCSSIFPLPPPAPRRDVISSWLGMSMEGGGETNKDDKYFHNYDRQLTHQMHAQSSVESPQNKCTQIQRNTNKLQTYKTRFEFVEFLYF